jgi:hypothetical protein
MPRVGFEPKIPVFERVKTVHALDRAATMIGYLYNSLGVLLQEPCSMMLIQDDVLWNVRRDGDENTDCDRLGFHYYYYLF